MDDEGASAGSAVAPQREAAQRGAPGGFSFEPPLSPGNVGRSGELYVAE